MFELKKQLKAVFPIKYFAHNSYCLKFDCFFPLLRKQISRSICFMKAEASESCLHQQYMMKRKYFCVISNYLPHGGPWACTKQSKAKTIYFLMPVFGICVSGDMSMKYSRITFHWFWWKIQLHAQLWKTTRVQVTVLHRVFVSS